MENAPSTSESTTVALRAVPVPHGISSVENSSIPSRIRRSVQLLKDHVTERALRSSSKTSAIDVVMVSRGVKVLPRGGIPRRAGARCAW